MRIEWMTAYGPRSGIVKKTEGDHHLVRLDNGKYVIVHKKSIRKSYEEKAN